MRLASDADLHGAHAVLNRLDEADAAFGLASGSGFRCSGHRSSFHWKEVPWAGACARRRRPNLLLRHAAGTVLLSPFVSVFPLTRFLAGSRVAPVFRLALARVALRGAACRVVKKRCPQVDKHIVTELM